ncbi:glycoside hydrolase family 20 zincin-like fold domain-containing protein [Streptomyces sp. NPDC090022]|uniref:glycoside hydrolase family 20 zincin-like fold domain-containing protein n=1 Tax=Streptomyces sp. NPDC090022 TaxID=3365920 RepID=UPI00381EE744
MLLAAAAVSTAAAPEGAAAAAGPVPLGGIVPAPASVRPGGSPYTLGATTAIRVDAGSAEARQVGEYLAGILRPSTGHPLPVVTGPGTDGIQLRLVADDRALGDEGYRLVSGPGTVRVAANRPAGLFHAAQTLRQLLPAAVERRTRRPGPWQISGGTQEIVRHAASRYLEVVPEIDTPGHTNAALASYAELNCDGVAPPLHTGTEVVFSKAYAWDPATLVRGMPAGAVLGVEAPLWTETLTTSAHLEYMAFPRLPGIAEIGWSPAATHNRAAYRQRLAAQGPRLDALGITFYRSPKVPWRS